MFKSLVRSGCTVAVLSWGAISVASAQLPLPANKPVYFTFNQPVALPEITLPAGKYLFRLADSQSDRRIIQVYAADGSKLHGMFMALHAQRPEPADEPEIRFLETPAGTPEAIATYWYPGLTTGYEFIYPPEQAARLAEMSNQSVLTTDDVDADLETAGLSRVNPRGERARVGGESQENQPDAVAGRSQAGEVVTEEPASYAGAGEGSDSERSAAEPAANESEEVQDAR